MEWELNPANPRTCDLCAEEFARFKAETPCFRCTKVRILPENETTVEIFTVLLSQLNVGSMGGVVGIDYSALPFLFQIHGVPQTEQKAEFEKLNVMVNKAMEIINRKKEETK